jgi:Tat protein translocase TatC
MWKPLLNKVFKMRDKVAMNLGKGDEEKPFLEHLDDLRTMLVRIAITLLVATLGAFFFYKDTFNIIMHPLVLAGMAGNQAEANTLLFNPDPTGAFMMAMNTSMIAGVIISFPFLMFFLLQFILPGLRPNEKKLIFPAIGVGAALFAVGLGFSYFSVLPRALKFFNDFGTDLGIKQMWTLDHYITFSTRFILVFGASFELPVLVMALVKLDFLSYKVMKSTRGYAIIGIFIFAAIITPTQDVLTLMLLAGPLYVLYEICIWLAYFMEKKDRAAYPEYYAEIEKDAAALEKESPPDEWDKEDYNPWDQSGSDEEDEDYKRSKNLASQDKTDSSEAVSGEPSAELERSAESKPAADAEARIQEEKPESPDDVEKKNPD